MLRKAFDRPALTTDVIVGFPGETDEEFQETVDYLTKLNLYEMHIFKFSPRQGTVAAGMRDQIGPEIKNLNFISDKIIYGFYFFVNRSAVFGKIHSLLHNHGIVEIDIFIIL